MSSSWHITYESLVIVSAAEQPKRRLPSIQKCESLRSCHLGDFFFLNFFPGPAPGGAGGCDEPALHLQVLLLLDQHPPALAAATLG